jgi:Ca2+-binding EF-hand superfamily protein
VRAFHAADVVGHGGLSMGGFVDALKKVGVTYSHENLAKLFATLDVHGNGTVELPEFEAVVAEWRAAHP